MCRPNDADAQHARALRDKLTEFVRKWNLVVGNPELSLDKSKLEVFISTGNGRMAKDGELLKALKAITAAYNEAVMRAFPMVTPHAMSVAHLCPADAIRLTSWASQLTSVDARFVLSREEQAALGASASPVLKQALQTQVHCADFGDAAVHRLPCAGVVSGAGVLCGRPAAASRGP